MIVFFATYILLRRVGVRRQELESFVKKVYTRHSTIYQYCIFLLWGSYLEFPFREKGLGNSRNTREFQGIPGNPRESRESTAVAGSWK